VIGEAGRGDAGAFLARLVRLDPAALVRLRYVRSGVAEMWAMLPFGALAVRALATDFESDITVGAAALLNALADPQAPWPPRRDEAWRWPIPPSHGRAVETVPALEVARVATAASRTLRAATEHGVSGRPVGERVVRDALLDHVPIVVTGAAGERVEVPQRLVQAVVRMGFLRPSGPSSPDAEQTERHQIVTVRLAGSWVGLAASYGSAWYRPTSSLHLR